MELLGTNLFLLGLIVFVAVVLAIERMLSARARKRYARDIADLRIDVPPKGTCNHNHPSGWWCSRPQDHGGACALWPVEIKPACRFCKKQVPSPCSTALHAQECRE